MMLETTRTSPEPWMKSLLKMRGAKTILLVDDDAVVRSAIKAILSEAGYGVLSCPDGSAALNLFAMRPSCDLLLTDFQMPGMTGFVLAETITNARPGMPVVMVSGATFDELPMRSMEDRQWRFLPKPVDWVRLLAILDELCGLTVVLALPA